LRGVTKKPPASTPPPPAVPMQRMTFDHKIDINKLSTIE